MLNIAFSHVLLAVLFIISAAFSRICRREIAKDNTLVCGVTIFENMNEKDADGNWTGFESEFAIEEIFENPQREKTKAFLSTPPEKLCQLNNFFKNA